MTINCIMELNESAKLRNILLDHYETPINVTLGTPSQLKKSLQWDRQ